MISVKRLKGYYEIEPKYDQGIGFTNYKKFEAKPGNFAVNLVNIDLNMNGNRIFNKLNLRIRQKERVGIIGPSGSGKHSLFKIILGIYKPDKVETKKVNLTFNLKNEPVHNHSQAFQQYIKI